MVFQWLFLVKPTPHIYLLSPHNFQLVSVHPIVLQLFLKRSGRWMPRWTAMRIWIHFCTFAKARSIFDKIRIANWRYILDKETPFWLNELGFLTETYFNTPPDRHRLAQSFGLNGPFQRAQVHPKGTQISPGIAKHRKRSLIRFQDN